jgi:hypothetical protein
MNESETRREKIDPLLTAAGLGKATDQITR